MIDVARHAPARVIRCFRWALLAPPDQYLVRRSLLNFVLSVSVSLAIVAVAVGIGRLAGAFEHPPETSGAEASLHFFVGAVLSLHFGTADSIYTSDFPLERRILRSDLRIPEQICELLRL